MDSEMEYRIQEVSEKLQVPVSTIRYWETEFADVIRPKRTGGGQRRYSERDIEQLGHIRDLLHFKNRSIAQARKVLKGGNADLGEINWEKKSILLTGGTGSFGKHFCKVMLKKYHPKVIRVYSRDELKQHEMRQVFGDSIRYFIGDVRDAERIRRAMEGADIVIHVAALKQVPACEYNPFEAIKTNIYGAQNIIDAAIDVGVQKVIALSCDTAVNPANLYGATKLCAEKIFIQGNAYSGARGTAFSCIRLPELLTREGNLLDTFRVQRKTGVLNIPDPEMTRFWPDFERAAESVLNAFAAMRGGEIFVPLSPTIRVLDLAEAFAPECRIRTTGMSQGERLHSILITEEEGRNIVFDGGMYIIPLKQFGCRERDNPQDKHTPPGFSYESRTNPDWLSAQALKEWFPATSRLHRKRAPDPEPNKWGIPALRDSNGLA